MAKSVKLKDRNNIQILPITRATTVEMNDGTNMQEKLDSIEDNILEVNYDSGNTALVFGSGIVKTYTITLKDENNVVSDITLNGTSYQTKDFPIEINEGDSLNVSIFCYDTCIYSTKMGDTIVSTSQSFSIQSVSGNIVITVKAIVSPGGEDPVVPIP